MKGASMTGSSARVNQLLGHEVIQLGLLPCLSRAITKDGQWMLRIANSGAIHSNCRVTLRGASCSSRAPCGWYCFAMNIYEQNGHSCWSSTFAENNQPKKAKSSNKFRPVPHMACTRPRPLGPPHFEGTWHAWQKTQGVEGY